MFFSIIWEFHNDPNMVGCSKAKEGREVNDLYMRLTYEQYKSLEDQLRRWEELETTHMTVEGGYHKALRIQISDTLILEFQGPLIKPPLEDPNNPPIQYVSDWFEGPQPQ